jgi:hypothetical protein
MAKSIESSIVEAFPGNDPNVKKLRSSVLSLVHLGERAEWSLISISGQIRLLLDSPMESAIDGVLAEDVSSLSSHLVALGLGLKHVAENLESLRTSR